MNRSFKNALYSETTIKVYCLFESLGSEMTRGNSLTSAFSFFFYIATFSPPFTLTPPNSYQADVQPDFAPTRLISPSVLMDLGRSNGKPRARLHIS